MKKKLIVVSAAAALSAAVPASALENDFHGSYKLKYFLSNTEKGATEQIKPSATSATAANYFEQRARLFYTAKANDDLKLVTGFEIDSVFGDKAQGGIDTGSNINTTAFRNSGGGLESDAVNLETKWVYLDFNIPSTPVNVRAGIQAYKDPFKGIFLDADLAGVYASARYGNAQTAIGYFRPYEAMDLTTGKAKTPRGTDNFDIAVLEGKYNINKDLTVGGAYFLYSDYRTNAPETFHTFGVNAEAKVGPAIISGFAAYQAGFSKQNTNGLTASKGTTVNAWAANVAAKVKAGPGTARTAFLYASGDQDKNDGVDHSWQSVSQTKYGLNTTTLTAPAGGGAVTSTTAAGTTTPNGGNPTNSYNESGMMLLNRNLAQGGTSTDTNIISNINNNGQGAVIITAGYDATLTPKVYASANVGAGLTSENQNTYNNGSHYLGTEVNVEVGYKLYDNLTAGFQAAYLFLGPYYKNAVSGQDPVDPYTTRVMLSYIF
ncbi:histidine kinase [Geobacter argillaceus]|uniref:Histidine kinase n=1 Tax=Geobacter argillaceus TaxID=345631 RepID=A0A562VI66_9BACT|nr:histidine kinase [Geobacter argillaceus]TWJ17562.1 hypothetical protein JN12_02957 [Geobacter argillaceus]